MVDLQQSVCLILSLQPLERYVLFTIICLLINNQIFLLSVIPKPITPTLSYAVYKNIFGQ